MPNAIDIEFRDKSIQSPQIDKLEAAPLDVTHNQQLATKSKIAAVSEDNRFVLPVGGTDQPDVGDNNVGGGGGEANVAMDGRSSVGEISDGGNGNASSAAGDSFTVAADDFESKLKYVVVWQGLSNCITFYVWFCSFIDN